jgi:hypothetical protein
MGRNSVVWFVGVGLALAACGGTHKNQNGDPAGSCTPGALTCNELDVVMCEDDGKTQTVLDTCAQACLDGACNDGFTTGGKGGTGGTSFGGAGGASGACEPDAQFCQDGFIYACNATGTSATLSKACMKGTYCVVDDGVPSCKALACNPNGPVCDGDVATVCKADGSGPLPGGQACADSGLSCTQGVCRDFKCEPGEKVCQGGDVYSCNPDGASAALVADCTAGQVCDATQSACRPKVCDPATLGCSGSLVVTCNDFGSDWLPPTQDCAMSGDACVKGECKEKTCTPNAQFCKGNDVHLCDGNGVNSSLSQTCTPGYYHCETYFSGSAYCAQNICNAGQSVCDNNILKTCTADGKIPATGTDCTADNKYCDSWSLTCQPKVCEVTNTTYCKNGDIYYCFDYASESLQQTCFGDTACKKAGDVTSCVPLLCHPGETSCAANKVGTCAEDGGSVTGATLDCAATQTVCTTAGTCAASVTDTLGISEDAMTASAGIVIGDAIEVHSARKVTSIEANLVLASTRELRWVIYELVGSTLVARVDKVVSTTPPVAPAWASSGPLSYTLKAGKRYLFAVTVNGGNFVTFYDQAPYETVASFGTVVGGLNTGYSANLSGDNVYGDYLYQMKISTVLP